MSAVQHRKDASWPFLCLSWLGYPDSSGWLRCASFVVTKVFDQSHSLCWFDDLTSIDSSRSLALVLLRDPADCQRPGCLRFHEESLKVVNCFVIATKRGLIDPFLQSVHLSFSLAPGTVCPVFDWLQSTHRFRFFPVTPGSLLHLTVPMSASPLAFPEAFAFSALLLSARLRVVACSLDRPPERASRAFFRSDPVCCVPVGSSLSAGSRG